MRRHIMPLTVLVLSLSACGSGVDADLAAAEVAVAEAVEDVTAACQDRDRDRLQDRLADQLHEQLRDRDRTQLFGDDGATLDLVSRTVEVEGDTATVTVVHAITLDGETTELERVWVFERTDDGDWVLTSLPDCLRTDE